MAKWDVWASGSTCMPLFWSTFSHSVIASVRVKVFSFRLLLYLIMRYFSSWSASDECNGSCGFAHLYSGVVATAARRARERENRILQAALRGVWQRGLWGDGGQTEPDVVPPRWVETVDGVPDLGAGRYQRGGRPGLLPGHCAHTRRRYVSWTIVQLQYLLLATLDLLIFN